MKNWHRSFPPYEGEEPYLYFAFADADEKKVWKYLRPLLERGCRVWYRFGPAGGAERLLHDPERSSGAALTLLFLTDAACADKDTKSNVLVNQKYGRPILCLDPDGTDRRLRMGLREDVPHVPLYRTPLSTLRVFPRISSASPSRSPRGRSSAGSARSCAYWRSCSRPLPLRAFVISTGSRPSFSTR